MGNVEDENNKQQNVLERTNYLLLFDATQTAQKTKKIGGREEEQGNSKGEQMRSSWRSVPESVDVTVKGRGHEPTLHN